MDDLRSAVSALAGVCVLVSVVECAVSENRSADGLRMLCGAAVAVSVFSTVLGWLRG